MEKLVTTLRVLLRQNILKTGPVVLLHRSPMTGPVTYTLPVATPPLNIVPLRRWTYVHLGSEMETLTPGPVRRLPQIPPRPPA